MVGFWKKGGSGLLEAIGSGVRGRPGLLQMRAEFAGGGIVGGGAPSASQRNSSRARCRRCGRGETEIVVNGRGRDPPDDGLREVERDEMVDVGDGGVDAVVGVGAGADVDEDGASREVSKARRAGCSGGGTRLKTGERKPAVLRPPFSPASSSKVFSVTPTWESTGHWSAENWAMEHWGVAWVLPMRPVGRWTAAVRASLQAQGEGSCCRLPSSKTKSTSGWAPAWFVLGRALK